ncbi:helix-turn-helix transcriptional regulator [Fodinisporobacter ferrooxydans]|uniref:Helix-turn-helix transcriptional regulator n=1 Tax=Fodinisporobacter ferrooxydans TaxID=2901836 RepID=A0ABY4CPZ2_9BACL|nr:helix-turn-helix transcriptional regulator [Alicyclobacillaceae bacterium MYW30-H2]
MAKDGVSRKQNRHLPAFLLLFLAEGDAHGGALWNRISDMMPLQWEIDSGAVYRVLRDLEERGSLTSYWNTEDTGPAKRIYHITEEGLQELILWYEDICLRKRNLEYFIRQFESLKNHERATGDEISYEKSD